LSVTFLDVGQGDSMLISFPQGSLMLLDSGGRIGIDPREDDAEDEDIFVEDRIGVGEAAVAPYLWRRGIKRLDWIAASHGDADHVEGFSEIVRSFEIGAVIKGALKRSDRPPGAFDGVANAPTRSLKRGDAIDFDGARIEVLSPFADQPRMSDNNESLVLRITFGARSFLLTGDIEKEAEARLVESNGDLRADVLKVAHHGSKTSSTIEFLERVNPRYAVISVARLSPFGHPHPEALARLRTTKALIWRTSDCGAITISTDGADLRVETFAPCGSGAPIFGG
jgi:competence protein ComEC